MEDKFKLSVLFKCGKEISLPILINKIEAKQIMEEFKSTNPLLEMTYGKEITPFGVFNKLEILGLKFDLQK